LRIAPLLGAVGDETFVMIAAIKHPGQSQLFLIVETFYAVGLLFGFGHSRKQQGSENRNDGDNDEKLDQGETVCERSGKGFGHP